MPVERSLRVAIAVLAIIGLAISTYLTIERVRGRSPFCVVGGDCATVQSSRYATFVGIPVPVLGLAGYATLLASAILPGNPGRLLGLLVGLVSLGFSAWLTYVELFILHAICTWCVASAVVVTLICVLAVWRALLTDPAGPPATSG